MRDILREIFDRYLQSEQFSFDASPRELWPTERFTPNGKGQSRPPEPDPKADVEGGLE
ncbi:MAG: hypothetical protein ACREEP_09770 [Dongiaceae bacterium]